MMKGPPGARHYRAPGSTLKRMEMVVALNEQAVVDVLRTLATAVSRNFHSEVQVLDLHKQIDGVVEQVEEDVKEDVEAVAAS